MFSTKKKTAVFDLNTKKDLEQYDDILNNSLCTVIKEHKEKMADKEFDNEGKMISLKEKIVLVVTWEEKKLL